MQLQPDTTTDRPDYRPLLKEIKKSEETRIVLDCDFDKIELILAQANEIELLTDYHNYLITRCCMYCMDKSSVVSGRLRNKLFNLIVKEQKAQSACQYSIKSNSADPLI